MTEHVSWLEVVADLDVVGAEKEQEFAKVRALHGSLRLLGEECCLYIFHGLAVGACLSEVFLSALAREDCLAVASEAVWPEVTKPHD